MASKGLATFLCWCLVLCAWGVGGHVNGEHCNEDVSSFSSAGQAPEAPDSFPRHLPLEESFDGTLGFPGEGPSGKLEGIRFGTLNATCWNSWEEAAKVEQQAADVWVVQEHKLCCPRQIRRIRTQLN